MMFVKCNMILTCKMVDFWIPSFQIIYHSGAVENNISVSWMNDQVNNF